MPKEAIKDIDEHHLPYSKVLDLTIQVLLAVQIMPSTSTFSTSQFLVYQQKFLLLHMTENYP
jgi:hypothetical protein